MKDDWPMASGICYMVENDLINEDQMDKIIVLLDNAIKDIETNKELNTINKAMDKIRMMREKEQKERIIDEEEYNHADYNSL